MALLFVGLPWTLNFTIALLRIFFSLAHGVRRASSPTEGLQKLQKLYMYLVIAIVQQYTAPQEFFIQQRMEEKSKYEILLERMDVDD